MLPVAGDMGCSAAIVFGTQCSVRKLLAATPQSSQLMLNTTINQKTIQEPFSLLHPGDLPVCRICVFLQQRLVCVKCADTFWEIQSRMSLIHACWRCPLIGHFEDLGADAHYINRKLT